MSLRVTFKPGLRQSMQAATYFTGAASNLVEGWIDHLQQRLYLMDDGVGGVLHLRVWTSTEPAEEELHHLLVWLMVVNEDVEQLATRRPARPQVERMVANWLARRHGGGSFLVERSVLPAGGASGEQTDFSLGVVAGRTVLVSNDSLMFTRLSEDVYGLAMVGQGSYLVEDIHEGEAFRRA